MSTITGEPVSGVLETMETCSRCCDVPFAWGITRKGKRMPIDLAPTEDGNLALMRDPMGVLQVTIMAKGDRAKGDRPKGDRYTSHFATCPEASRFRR